MKNERDKIFKEAKKAHINYGKDQTQYVSTQQDTLISHKLASAGERKEVMNKQITTMRQANFSLGN